MEPLTKPRIICISGKAQHGKDTFAVYLESALANSPNVKIGNKPVTERNIKIAHFGDALKYVCYNFCNWDGHKDHQGREMLQRIGTDVVRARDPEFWTRFLTTAVFAGSMSAIKSRELAYVIVPDCRFLNEIDCWERAGFDKPCCIYIKRPGFKSDLTALQQAHPSEMGILENDPRIDYVISNDADLYNLNIQAQLLVHSIVGRGEPHASTISLD